MSQRKHQVELTEPQIEALVFVIGWLSQPDSADWLPFDRIRLRALQRAGDRLKTTLPEAPGRRPGITP